jgi:hypothetical protein
MNSPRTRFRPLLLAAGLLWSAACLADDSGAGAAQGASPPAAAAAPAPDAPAAPAPAAPEASGQPTSSAASATASTALPALNYHSDSVTGDLFDPIQHTPQFEKLSREALGSPIELHVYHTFRIDRGAATATGLLAAATLGLIPQVSNGHHSIVYEVLVNGVLLTSYRYSTALTRVRNIWSQDKTQGLGEDGVKWVRSTVDLFLKDASADPKLAALRTEFDYYFGSAKP